MSVREVKAALALDGCGLLAPGDVRLDARYGDTDCALFVDPTSPPNPLTVTVDIKKLLTGPFV